MKKFLILPFLFVSLFVGAQQTSRLIAGQSKPYRTLHADNFLYVDTLPGGEYRIWAVTVDSFLVKPHNMKWLKDSVVMIGNQRFVQLAGAYSNPAWVNSLSAGKVFGLSSVATTGDYGDLTNKPNLSLYYLSSNPSGYISGITGSLVTGALGYSPVNPNGTSGQYIAGDGSKITFPTIPTNNNQLTNGSGYLTAINSGQVTTALGYTPVNPSRTLTINGTTYDLSSNRSWTVGDILASGSYSDPSWITGLAYSKLTGAPTIKRQEAYSGTTNSSGVYTVTYGTAFSVVPNVQFQLGTGANNKETILLTSSTTTGCSFYVQLRTDVLGLLPSYSNVNGRNVDVLVTAK